MIDVRLEKLADDIRDTMCPQLPVDPVRIAKDEGILLGPGQFGECFSGRIEYHPQDRKFLLFYPASGNPRRIRFSISHELGHYYIVEHRERLLAGSAHDSNAGFICDEQFEREADSFAASLLIPRRYIEKKTRSLGFMTLEQILAMADDCESSITCAALRYAQYAEEACAVVLSQSGRIMYGISSDEMAAIGFKIIKKGTAVPAHSATAKCQANPQRGIVAGRTVSTGWFANHYKTIELWEEAVPLGYAGQVITLLSRETTGEDNEDDE